MINQQGYRRESSFTDIEDRENDFFHDTLVNLIERVKLKYFLYPI